MISPTEKHSIRNDSHPTIFCFIKHLVEKNDIRAVEMHDLLTLSMSQCLDRCESLLEAAISRIGPAITRTSLIEPANICLEAAGEQSGSACLDAYLPDDIGNMCLEPQGAHQGTNAVLVVQVGFVET